MVIIGVNASPLTSAYSYLSTRRKRQCHTQWKTSYGMKARKDLEKEKNINQTSPVKIARMYKHQNESHMHIYHSMASEFLGIKCSKLLFHMFYTSYRSNYLSISISAYSSIYWQVTFLTSASSIISQYVSKLVRTRLLFHQYFLPFFSLLIRFHQCVVPS